eukprot:TRINITY_DN595_c0_g2_i1.p1 TRINITY_DN595_c0_g2~~TRINITY_DN595_c0_g2_i1.p1  ORF type:complete len:125 (+),score=62.90 TRINITY_DN595_c0_g2_i1:156-530(+)
MPKTEKASALRHEKKKELLKKLKTLKEELLALRINKASTGTAQKLGQIKPVKKAIARILTVLNQKHRLILRYKYAGKKFKPLDIRPKLTRSKRHELPSKFKKAKTLRQKKFEANFPRRAYAVRA